MSRNRRALSITVPSGADPRDEGAQVGLDDAAGPRVREAERGPSAPRTDGPPADPPTSLDHSVQSMKEGRGPLHREVPRFRAVCGVDEGPVSIDVPTDEWNRQFPREIVEQRRIAPVELRRHPPREQGFAQILIAQVDLPPHNAAVAELAIDPIR